MVLSTGRILRDRARHLHSIWTHEINVYKGSEECSHSILWQANTLDPAAAKMTETLENYYRWIHGT